MESILIQARTGGDDKMPGTINLDNNYRLHTKWGRTFKYILKDRLHDISSLKSVRLVKEEK